MEATENRSGQDRWLLLGLLVLALGLRLWQFSWGLPFNYQVSEQMYMYAAQQVQMHGAERIHPLFGFFQEVVLGAWRALQLVLPLLDRLALSQELQVTLHSFTMSFHFVARLLNAVLGALTLLPIYWIGRRAANRRVGLMAALFWAVCFMSVRNSHYAKPDATSCFLAATAVLVFLGLEVRGSTWRYVLAGVLTGLTLSTKLLAWPLLVLIPLFHFTRSKQSEPASWGRHLGQLGAAYLSVVVTFLLGCPQIFIDREKFAAFWKYVGDQGKGGGMDRFNIHFSRPFYQVYLRALDWGLGSVLLALCGLGVVLLLVRRQPRPLALLLVFPALLYVFLLLPGNMAHDRYVMLGIPYLLLAAACCVDAVAARLPERARAWATAALLLLAVAQPLVASIRHDELLGRVDTRTLALRWIESHVPEGTQIALEPLWFGPQLSSPKIHAPLTERVYRTDYSGAYGLSEKSKKPGPSRGTWTIEDYVDRGVEYLVSDGYTARLPLLDPEEDRVKRAFYAELEQKGQLVAEFSPFRKGESIPFFFDQVYGPVVQLTALERPGPVLKIYRLPVKPPGHA